MTPFIWRRHGAQPFRPPSIGIEQNFNGTALSGADDDIEAAIVLAGVDQAPDILFSTGAATETMKNAQFVPPNVDQIAVVDIGAT